LAGKYRRQKMKRANAVVKVRSRQAEKVNVEAEISKGAIGTLAVASGLVGAWCIAAFVGGIIASGGVMPLVSNWVQAVFG
jgi:hypothetical protein